MNESIGFAPTDQQKEIVEATRGRQSIIVEAGAGCAKTSTLKMAAPGVKVPALALAFGKRNADDMSKALPQNFTVKSFNALGHGAWARSLGNLRVTLDDRKLSKIVSGILKARKIDQSKQEDIWGNTKDLVTSAMQAGLVPRQANAESLVEDTRDGWWQVSNGLGPSDFADCWELAQAALTESVKQARAGTISFDDQIYCSTMLGGRFAKYPVVIVDEDQDLSPLQIRMLTQSVLGDGRVIAVGDKRQAIFAWRGAAGDAASRIKEISGIRAFGSELPLLTTFRCPKVVVNRQQEHVPGFCAAPSAPDGQFEHWRPAFGALPETWEGWDWKKFSSSLPHPRASVAVLCRNNAPLVKFAMQLIRQGIGINMLGRDLGKGLTQLAVKISGKNLEMPVEQFGFLLYDWRHQQAQLATDFPAKQTSINDKADCLLAVLDQSKAKTVGELVKAIEFVFTQEGIVTLSSIHRAKGLEWECVLILDPWRIPSKQAQRAAAAGYGLALEQEMNLKYVAETRTKHTLLLASADDFRGERE